MKTVKILLKSVILHKIGSEMEKVVSVEKLQRIAFDIRKNVLQSLAAAGSGHLGGSLGLSDVFALLYFHLLNHRPEDPQWEYRDRLILSVGHVAPVLYAALAQSGYFHEQELLTLRQLDSPLQGHPGKDFGLPGIEISSGSLGQGLSVSVGIALAAKMDKKSFSVYTVMGDGELQEGSIWEAAMSASFYKLDNMIAIVDRNNKQIDGDTEDVMALEPLADKWRSFGWECFSCNGNNISELIDVFSKIKLVKGRPRVLIAKTLMGKGVQSIEGDYRWHGKVPDARQLEQFTHELEQSFHERNH
jgi:transketolase